MAAARTLHLGFAFNALINEPLELCMCDGHKCSYKFYMEYRLHVNGLLTCLQYETL
jgi:hypothetical protein